MRLMKRLAVCALAAALSLTMLTACGGDTPAAPSNPSAPAGSSASSGASGKPEEKPASSASSKPASSAASSGASSSASSKPEEKPASSPASSKPEEKPASSDSQGQKYEDVKDGTEIELQNSRSGKLMQEMYNSSKFYMKLSGKAQGQDAVEEQARDGDREWQRWTLSGKVMSERLSVARGNLKDMYSLYSSQKFATLHTNDKTTDSIGSDNINDYEFSVVKTTCVVNAVPYYAETVSITEKGETTPMQTQTLCYDSTGKLVYIVGEDEGQQVVMKVEELSHVIPNSANLSIPDDWELYTYGTGADGETIVTDKSGHQLTDEEQQAMEQKTWH